jgi:FAD synthase
LFSCQRPGKKPTIKGEHQAGAETHLFDFNDMIYGEKIEVELLEFIRPERKFGSVELLKRQLDEDVLKCKAVI